MYLLSFLLPHTPTPAYISLHPIPSLQATHCSHAQSDLPTLTPHPHTSSSHPRTHPSLSPFSPTRLPLSPQVSICVASHPSCSEPRHGSPLGMWIPLTSETETILYFLFLISFSYCGYISFLMCLILNHC
jgi:hypothetical protein